MRLACHERRPQLRHRLQICPLIGVQFWPLCAAGFAGSARLVGAGRDSRGETSAGRVIVVSAFEPPAIVAGLDVKSRFNSVFSNRGSV